MQDTFVVGCKFSEKNIYPETFKGNPDYRDPVYSTEFGVYSPHCGLDNVMLSWGHDEVRQAQILTLFKANARAVQYLYSVLKNQSSLPEDALHMIRYHSFYPCVHQSICLPTI